MHLAFAFKRTALLVPPPALHGYSLRCSHALALALSQNALLGRHTYTYKCSVAALYQKYKQTLCLQLPQRFSNCNYI